MLEINLRSFLSEFNGSKFVLYFFLLAFSIVFPLRLDRVIAVNYFVVFTPLWICEILIFLGFLIGLVSFLIAPPARVDSTLRNDFFAMCFCALEHILLVLFELLCCYKLEFGHTPDGEELSWLLVFVPLFVQCFMAMVISVWSIRHDKSFEFEMFFSLNVVQFVFIAFKLDDALGWNWVIVFVPAWVIFSLCLVGTLYSLILSIFLSRSLHVLSAHRRSHIFNSICHILLTIPLLTFFLLLASKLDAIDWIHERSADHVPFTLVASPLWVSLFLLLFMAFGSKSGNTWWFAMRKPFCQFIFEAFPCLQQYANISYKFGYNEEAVPPPPARRPPSSGGNSGIHGEHLQMLPPRHNFRDVPTSSGSTMESVQRMPSMKSHHYRVCSIEMPD